MEFFNSAIQVLQTLVIALGAGLGIWGAVNLLEGYGNDNPGAKKAGHEATHGGRRRRFDWHDAGAAALRAVRLMAVRFLPRGAGGEGA